VLWRGRAERPLPWPAAALGIDERAQVVEAVCGEQASGDQLPKSGFYFGF